MTARDDLAAWLRLTLIPGVGFDRQRQLLKAFGLPAAIFAQGSMALGAIVGSANAANLLGHDCAGEIDSALAWALEPGNHIVTLADADYPQALLDLADPPPLLYVKGRTDLLNRPAVAIVGSRNASRQGEANAVSFAGALSAAGLVIVSGLALGCDAAAHRGALDAGGATLAVIGTGADRIYPARNADLARRIAANGAIVSEFPPGTPPLAANFPRRNRIIAGLSRGCLVIEAAEQSGSLITARLAAEAGREVFALPGSIHAALSRGCHKLIKQGAKLVENAADILEELRWEAAISPALGRGVGGGGPSCPLGGGKASPALGRGPGGGGLNLPEGMPEGEEDSVLLALGHDPCDLESLAARTGLSAEALLARLLPLELDGRIAQLPGSRYQRVD